MMTMDCDDKSDYVEMKNNNTDDENKLNRKIIDYAREIEYNESKEEIENDNFDGSGLNTWWD